MANAEQIALDAKLSFDASQLVDSHERHKALVALKEALTTAKSDILAANQRDIEVRPLSLSHHLSPPAPPLTRPPPRYRMPRSRSPRARCRPHF